MKKIILFIISVAIWTLAFAGHILDSESKRFNTQCSQTEKRLYNPSDSTKRTYENRKLGISFSYPTTWDLQGKETEAIDISGNVNVIELNFKDSITQTTLLVSYHLAPKGAELYLYSLSQFRSSIGWYDEGKQQLKIAGKNALQASKIISKNAKGFAINPPLRIIIVDFLDKKETGEIQLQFKTPASETEEIESGKFRSTLSSFKFTN